MHNYMIIFYIWIKRPGIENEPTIPIRGIWQDDPGSDRQGAFRRGWITAVKDLDNEINSSKYFEGPPPDSLTGDNLGYRLRGIFGETDDRMRQELFGWGKRKQQRERDS